MKDDRLQVLRMIESGKISAEEGLRLLEACEGAQEVTRGSRPRWLRVRVFHPSTGRTKANVNVPLSLLETGLRFIPGGVLRLGPDLGELDLDGVLRLVRSGQLGKVLELTSEEEDVKVEIYVD